MEAQAATQKTTIHSQYVAINDHVQSTTGVETWKMKDPLDTSRFDKGHACTDIEIPHTHITVPTARTTASSSAEESDMESVNISSDNEFDDGWSTISDRSDFVVVDSAGITHQSSDSKSRKESVVPKRVPKLHDRLRTLRIRPRRVIPSQNEQGGSKMKPTTDAGN